MLIKDIMSHDVIAIGPEIPIVDAVSMMKLRNIQHFPIMDTDGLLVGIVSERDLLIISSEHEFAPDDIELKDPVNKIMTQNVKTCNSLEPIEDVAKRMLNQNIGSMPVIDNNKLVGIVTAKDFLKAVDKISGGDIDTCRIEVEVENQPGALAKLLNFLAERKVNVNAVMTSWTDLDVVCFVLRVVCDNPDDLISELQKADFHILWPLEHSKKIPNST